MKEDEYDALIDSPTEFLANVWMPRISDNMVSPGEPNTYRNNMAWLKGGLSLMAYGGAIGGATEKLNQRVRDSLMCLWSHKSSF
jgi:hypothetical protein